MDKKICITFANEIQKDNDLMATLLNVSSFETFFDILEHKSDQKRTARQQSMTCA